MDPTLQTLAKLNDLSQWDNVKYNVPIFVEHELWEVPHPFNADETCRVAILPGQPKPKSGKMLYSVGPEDLTKISQKINARLQDSGNAVKIFVGHTNLNLPQKSQPDLVGYGVGASVVPSGPKGRLAVVLKRSQYIKGRGKDAAEYPERSPEFDPIKGELTGLALLKTDPKLPMGLVTYSSEIAGYEGVFRGVIATYSSDSVTVYYDGAMTKDLDPKQTPVGGDPSAPPDATELQGEEATLADRFMKHYERTSPIIKYMCGKYAQECQAANEPVGTPPVGEGETPGEKSGDKTAPTEPNKPATEVPMANETAQYAQMVEEFKAFKGDVDAKLAVLQTSNDTFKEKYANEQSLRIITELLTEGYVIKDAKKAVAKLKTLDDQGRVDYANDVRENYAKSEVAPTGPMIGIFDEPAPGAKREATAEEVDQVVLYAEKNKVDLESGDGFEKCLDAIRKVS